MTHAERYQREQDFKHLGKAIKYAGLLGKEVRVTGHNAETLAGPTIQ